MNSNQKIALYGRSGSGKSLISRYLANAHGYLRYSTGDLCRKISLDLFGNEKRSNLNALSQKIREIDQFIWIKAVLRNASQGKIVFESVRYLEDMPYLTSLGFQIWRVECSEDLCRQRLVARGQVFTDDDLNHASESFVNEVIPFNQIIDNGNRSIDLVYKDVDKALKVIR